MSDHFANVYADAERAKSYASLDYPGTYYLAFRDLPALQSGEPTPLGHLPRGFRTRWLLTSLPGSGRRLHPLLAQMPDPSRSPELSAFASWWTPPGRPSPAQSGLSQPPTLPWLPPHAPFSWPLSFTLAGRAVARFRLSSKRPSPPGPGDRWALTTA
jgi:hypothetical protein